MAALYITSSEKGSGKTAICAALGKQLAAKGKKVGYFKPVTTTAGSTASGDTDAEFIKMLLSLPESEDSIRPVISMGSNLNTAIKDAFTKVSQVKDIVIIEGSSEQFLVSNQIAAALNAKVIIVEAWSKELLKSTDYKRFGQSLLGVILNKVPKTKMVQAQAEAAAKLSKAGANLLGILPEDRTLVALSVAEVAESIGGEILNNAERSSDLVENVMLGALGLDPGIDYFSRKSNKCVVLKGERPDMGIAALETSNRCLVISGTPNQLVTNSARNHSTPVIVAKEKVADLVAKIEDAVTRTRFNQFDKMPKITEILNQHVNIQKLYQAIGVS